MAKSKVTIGHVFKTIIWPRKNQLLVGLVLIVISRLAGLVLPGASKYLMDDVIPNNNMETLKILLLAVAGAILVQAITSFALTQILSANSGDPTNTASLYIAFLVKRKRRTHQPSVN
jgi:subfamily B ATP-binding cassette protein MsbA